MNDNQKSAPGIMTAKHSQYVTREAVLKMLSDEEIARVSNSESGFKLTPGEDYLDLEHLERGVLQSDGVAAPMGRLLPRKSIQNNTWDQIVEFLAIPRIAAA